MFVDEIVRIANSYFAMSEEEARVALSKSSLDENYLSAILTSVEPFFKRYLTQTSVELRRKIGRVAFEKLNNANFLQESVTKLKIRLTEFFNLTSDYGINPYEIFYASVIASAHNFYNREGNFSSYKQKVGNFTTVSRAIEKQLGLSREKVAKMYERCSSLAYRVDTEKVADNFDALLKLGYRGESVLSYVDVKEILRNNPSLYTCGAGQIRNAYVYLVHKAELFVKKSGRGDVLSTLNSWIKNNSSVLAINIDGMKRKETALYNYLIKITSRDEATDVLLSLFDNPTNISAINKISFDTFFKKDNYQKVIDALVEFLDKRGKTTKTVQYLKNSKLVYSIDNRRLYAFLKKLKESDENENTILLQKFVEKGDAIFPYFERYNDDEIIEKLKTNKILYRIKLYNMTKANIVQKFYEVFAENGEEKFDYFEGLMRENYNLDLIAKNVDIAEDALQNLAEDYLKNAQKVKENIENFFATLAEYEEKYLKTDLKTAIEEFEKKVDKVKKEIDTLYDNGVDSAKKRYDNVDALYTAFRENTEQKLYNNNNPFARKEEFSRKLNEAVEKLKGEVETKQLSLYDYKEADEDKLNALKILKLVQGQFNSKSNGIALSR